MKKFAILFTVILFSALALNAADKVKVDSPAPNFTLKDHKGNEHSLSDFKGKYVVLEWINFGCPFVKKHYDSENMQNLQKKYTGKDVVWLSICSSAEGKQGYMSSEKISKKLNDLNGAQTAYLIDKSGKVGKMYNAKTTPNMYVIDPDGNLIYKGAIDDKPSTDTDDVDDATNYVSNCLDAAMNGSEVEVKSTKPYGCGVKYSEK